MGQSIGPIIEAKHLSELSEYSQKNVQTGNWGQNKIAFQETTGHWFPCPSMKYEKYTSDSSFVSGVVKVEDQILT